MINMQMGRIARHIQIKSVRNILCEGKVQNDIRLEFPEGVQKPIFPGLFVICVMAMLSFNEQVFGKTKIHLSRL